MALLSKVRTHGHRTFLGLAVEFNNNMKERPFQFKNIKQKEYEPVHLPPPWCGAICRNAMSEICIEQCAINRDCSGFDPKPNLKLGDLPRFPLETSANMTREEKFTSVTVYLAKVVDHLNGVDDKQYDVPFVSGSPATHINTTKVIAEVAAGIQRELSDPESTEVKNTTHQPTQANSEIGSVK